jgi:hypothetical protein
MTFHETDTRHAVKDDYSPNLLERSVPPLLPGTLRFLQ